MIFKPRLASINVKRTARLTIIRIHREAYCIEKLQNAINAKFLLTMENQGKNEKPLCILKLISHGLITFDVSGDLKLVVN